MAKRSPRLLFTEEELETPELQKPIKKAEKAQKTADGWKIAVENTAKATELILAHPEIFKDYEVLKGNMDDVFLSVTGKAMKEEGEAK